MFVESTPGGQPSASSATNLSSFISPFFQQIVTVEHHPYALEALFRLRGCNILPAKLFGQWERTGYICHVDLAMIRCVRLILSAQATRIRVTVNVSPQTIRLMQEALIAELCALAAVTRRTIVEITEHMEPETAMVVEFARRLDEHGIYLALDDCRMSHVFTSRSFVEAVRPKFLKIDGGVVTQCVLGGDRHMLCDIVSLASSVGAVAIAEWVDSEEKRDFMASAGVQYLQGHLFGVARAWTTGSMSTDKTEVLAHAASA